MNSPLVFNLFGICSSTRARAGLLKLKKPDSITEFVEVLTPVFMPVGTNGTMKGILPNQIEATGCRLMLSNTYHLGSRPGSDVVENAGGLHKFMNWPHGLLTDSGGFQMVSLSDLMEINEEGASFSSPYQADQILHLTPEKAVQIQHQIGANIIMQLDDVIDARATDSKRFEEATYRTVRWFDRCRAAHKPREKEQNLFPIIQGGLDRELRLKCAKELSARDPPGIAIGGLSGGEAKDQFIEMVACSTEQLPPGKPRYLMGVGFAVDMMMCVALGCDMFDCVFPTRTARFGCALVGYGKQLNLKSAEFINDFGCIESNCDCVVCEKKYSRSYIHHLMRQNNTVGCHLLTQHNIRFQMRFMNTIRESILSNQFNQFMKTVLDDHFGSSKEYPTWIQKGLKILDLKF